MGRTPDRFPGKRFEETLALLDQAAPPALVGEIQRNGDDIFAKDSAGVYNLRTGGSGITESQHEGLDTLVHRIAENAFEQVVRNAQNRVTDIIVWTNAGMTVKIRETNIVRVANKVSSVTQKQYDGAGVIIVGQTLASTIARDTAGRVDDITHVES